MHAKRPTRADMFTRIRIKVLLHAFPYLFRADISRTDMIRLGTKYGGWWVPSHFITHGAICYTAGTGSDISFDLELASLGCEVRMFDPTPRAIEWISGQALPKNAKFYACGVSDQRGTVRFYEPADPTHSSYSMFNLQKTQNYVTAAVDSIFNLMVQLGDEWIDLLKLDVEGAEHRTIKQMLADQIQPLVVCVEFDQPESLKLARQTMANLKSFGYRVAKVEGFNVTLVRVG